MHCGEMLNKLEDDSGLSPTQFINPVPRRQPGFNGIPKTFPTTNIQTIELTSKKYKFQGCLSGILLGIAVFFIVLGTSTSSSGMVFFSTFLFLIGLVWLIIVRLLVWWHHD